MKPDDDLARRFAELRSWDGRRAPSFDASVRAPRPGPVRWVPLAAVAAVAGLVVLSLVVPRLRPHPGERIRWLVNWESPTTSLLAVPGPDVSRVPSLSASVIHPEEP